MGFCYEDITIFVIADYNVAKFIDCVIVYRCASSPNCIKWINFGDIGLDGEVRGMPSGLVGVNNSTFRIDNLNRRLREIVLFHVFASVVVVNLNALHTMKDQAGSVNDNTRGLNLILVGIGEGIVTR